MAPAPCVPHGTLRVRQAAFEAAGGEAEAAGEGRKRPAPGYFKARCRALGPAHDTRHRRHRRRHALGCLSLLAAAACLLPPRA